MASQKAWLGGGDVGAGFAGGGDGAGGEGGKGGGGGNGGLGGGGGGGGGLGGGGEGGWGGGRGGAHQMGCSESTKHASYVSVVPPQTRVVHTHGYSRSPSRS